MQNLKKNWSVVSKMTRIWWILIRALRNLQNLHFDWFLLCKVYNTWPKKCIGVILHDTEEWCNIWRKTDLRFGKCYEEFGKFSPEHLKMSKLGILWDPFVQSRTYVNQTFTEELCVITLKNDAKFEEELTWHLKMDTKNLTKLWPKHMKVSKIFTLISSFWGKYILFELKK